MDKLCCSAERTRNTAKQELFISAARFSERDDGDELVLFDQPLHPPMHEGQGGWQNQQVSCCSQQEKEEPAEVHVLRSWL